jgi:hypothetical protein
MFRSPRTAEVVEIETATVIEKEPEPVVVIDKINPLPLRHAVVAAGPLEEYAKFAAELGILEVADVTIEKLKACLIRNDFPVFSLPEVVTYMDKKVKSEGMTHGWQWKPLRIRDRLDVAFGTRSEVGVYGITRASDRYQGAGATIYDRTVPLHALRKVSVLEKELGAGISFLVSDYVAKPEFVVDPFLMVVVKNPDLDRGIGRFVVDFWDEPGFGIEQQLAK